MSGVLLMDVMISRAQMAHGNLHISMLRLYLSDDYQITNGLIIKANQTLFQANLQ